jgi:hypothetical protein
MGVPGVYPVDKSRAGVHTRPAADRKGDVKWRTGPFAVIAVLGLAGCGSASLVTTPPGTSGATGATSQPVQTIEPTEAPTPTATPALTGPLGTEYSETDTSTNTAYDVTLTSVVDPARTAPDYGEAAVSGTHYVVLHFSVLGVSGIVSDEDAQADANMTGTDGNPYQTGEEAAGCELTTSLNGTEPYEFSLTPGATADPCVVFDVLNGVKVGTVTWGLDDPPATWTVNPT